MSDPVRHAWTPEDFAAWASVQDERYEFDGDQPVAMTGGTVAHGQITQRLQYALARRLAGGPCQPLGPDLGVRTVGRAMRYPDALITCEKLVGSALAVSAPVVVFEVLSAGSGRTDRLVKVREYAAVASIRRYVVLESASQGMTVLERDASGQPWRAGILIGSEDILHIPEIGISIPVAELYDGIDLA